MNGVLIEKKQALRAAIEPARGGSGRLAEARGRRPTYKICCIFLCGAYFGGFAFYDWLHSCKRRSVFE